MSQNYKANESICEVALIGNPNSGKSTLFNRLTGLKQQIGNWPGVTVEQKLGKLCDSGNSCVQVIDLPGCYSLIATADMSRDERITCDFVAQHENILYINVVDAAHLQRDLYLTLQLLELGKPVLLALNCIDIANKNGLQIDSVKLAQQLGCPVIAISAKTGFNLDTLRQQILQNTTNPILNNYHFEMPPELQPHTLKWQDYVSDIVTLRIFEGDVIATQKLCAVGIDVAVALTNVQQQVNAPLDLLLAQWRREKLQNIFTGCVQQHAPASSLSKKIDALVLHKIFGPLIFVAVMYSMFTFAINLGGFLQQVFDQVSEAIFVNAFTTWLSALGAAPWLINLLAHGVGKGLNITVTFIPVLATMFLGLGILESSGYMTRAAFIVDRIMRVFGLPGKAFVPLIVGFGCNVPAVMGTRTLAQRHERILTIMMTPFMSCGARLVIYAIFVSAFFPLAGQNVIFSLYMVGILVAMLTGLALRTTVIAENSPTLMEMSDYRLPTLNGLLRQVWWRLKSFIIKAGGLIIILAVLLNGVGYNNLEKFGKSLTPMFAPIGISEENWPATVGLVTGLLAKEAVIGTLNSVYSLASGSNPDIIKESSLSRAAENEMLMRFGSTTAAYAYLLFTLLYFPCISVVAVIAKELNKRWALFAVAWSTSLAYIVAALYYQIATWQGLYSTATAWIIALSLILFGIYVTARKLIRRFMQAPSKYKPVPTLVTVSN
jgi:ferrous iron transport protein B